jgi:hypothetical protein
MATTTPNYGWTVPTSTDLVKDGATAIETLGDAIDASMNTALGTKKAGLVLLNTTSFSAVASQSINDVFSATYQNYLILGNLSGSTGNPGDFRLRVSGADNSTNNYIRQTINADSTTLAAATQTSTLWTQFFVYSTADTSIFEAIITNPFATAKTGYFARSTQEGSSLKIQGGYHNVSSSFTGFTLLAQSGNTITGTVRVYGYNN